MLWGEEDDSETEIGPNTSAFCHFFAWIDVIGLERERATQREDGDGDQSLILCITIFYTFIYYYEPKKILRIRFDQEAHQEPRMSTTWAA